MQRTNNPFISNFLLPSVYLNTLNQAIEINQGKIPIMRTPIWSRTPNPKVVVTVEPKPMLIEAQHLQIGDIIELPVTQRLIVTEINNASDGAVVVGTKMLVLQCDGHEGVFNGAEATPIALSFTTKINLVQPVKEVVVAREVAQPTS
jgi:hypothetical protein